MATGDATMVDAGMSMANDRQNTMAVAGECVEDVQEVSVAEKLVRDRLRPRVTDC